MRVLSRFADGGSLFFAVLAVGLGWVIIRGGDPGKAEMEFVLGATAIGAVVLIAYCAGC